MVTLRKSLRTHISLPQDHTHTYISLPQDHTHTSAFPKTTHTHQPSPRPHTHTHQPSPRARWPSTLTLWTKNPDICTGISICLTLSSRLCDLVCGRKETDRQTDRQTDRCASACVAECRICNREVAGSNLGRDYFAPRSTQPTIPPGSVNEYQLRLGRQRQVWLIPPLAMPMTRKVCR